VDLIQHYVIKFVSDLQQVSGFLRVLRFPSPIKLTSHDITEIFLKVALNTITPLYGIKQGKPGSGITFVHIFVT
jgi:hypothetical protein